MKHVMQMTAKMKTPYEAIDHKKVGQQVITNVDGKVVKVVTVTGKTKTDQSFKDDTDLNHILMPAIKKGLLRHAVKYEGEYDDFPDFDFQEAQFQLARANSMFEELPSAIRVRFNNKPSEFIDFVNNPDNAGKLAEMGLSKGLDGLKADGSATAAAQQAAEQAAETPPAPAAE